MKFLVFLILFTFNASAQTLVLAVASNFHGTLKTIAAEFERNTGIETDLIIGSTGGLFSQINNGAPYDIYFSADQKRPALLVEMGLTVEHSLESYAEGQLAFYIPDQLQDVDFLHWLSHNQGERIVIANPKTAPYGHAAEQVLRGLSLLKPFSLTMIRAGNISKVTHVLQTGNAKAGFVALSSMKSLGKTNYRLIPSLYHDPILQDAVILKRTTCLREARQFMAFLKTPKVQQIMERSGYLPIKYATRETF